MAGNLVHFELGAKDTGRAREFWSSLFGWKFQPPWGEMEYHMTEGLEPGGANLQFISDPFRREHDVFRNRRDDADDYRDGTGGIL